jgi:hypothetical protein
VAEPEKQDKVIVVPVADLAVCPFDLGAEGLSQKLQQEILRDGYWCFAKW